jgi:hypothetical protein
MRYDKALGVPRSSQVYNIGDDTVLSVRLETLQK